MDKGDLMRGFPGLKDDNVFQTSPMSPKDSNYNCIAWAYQMQKDKWMWPPVDNNGMEILPIDGCPWWPKNAKIGLDIECLVDAFEKKGFVKCDSWEHEQGFIRVALYYDPKNNHMTHAARESRIKNCWMSKMGRGNDIQHANPYTIEGDLYGKVYCIMKMPDK